MIAIIMNKKSIKSDKGLFYSVELSTSKTAFVTEEQFNQFKIGDTVLTQVSKYKAKDGSWKSSISLVKVTIG